MLANCRPLVPPACYYDTCSHQACFRFHESLQKTTNIRRREQAKICSLSLTARYEPYSFFGSFLPEPNFCPARRHFHGRQISPSQNLVSLTASHPPVCRWTFVNLGPALVQSEIIAWWWWRTTINSIRSSFITSSLYNKANTSLCMQRGCKPQKSEFAYKICRYWFILTRFGVNFKIRHTAVLSYFALSIYWIIFR